MLIILQNVCSDLYDMLTHHTLMFQENSENRGDEEMPQPHDSAKVCSLLDVVYIKVKGEKMRM